MTVAWELFVSIVTMAVTAITFINQSGLPVMVETWQQVTYGLNTLVSKYVAAGETVVLHSITGEWSLNCMFDCSTHTKEWRDQGFNYITLGKFSNKPYIDGEYGYMDQDDFFIKYDNNTATFMKL